MIKRWLEKRRYMREHRWTHAHYSAFLDGELTEAERARVEEHVGVCPVCRRMLASLKRTLSGLRGLAVEPSEPGIADTVIDRLRGEG
jgi:anti-sigma factor RsiW